MSEVDYPDEPKISSTHLPQGPYWKAFGRTGPTLPNAPGNPREAHRAKFMFRAYTFIGLLALAAATVGQARIHVSPGGAHSGNGTAGNPLSLNAALERAQADSSIDELVLAAGVYEVLDPIRLNNLQRSADQPLKIRPASRGAKVVIRGGRSLNGAWRAPSKKDPIVAAMPVAARPAVRVASLRDAGIDDYGVIRNRGFSNRQLAAGELFINGRRQPIAGYPNVGDNRGGKEDPFGVEYGFQKYAEASDGAAVLPSGLAARLSVAENRDDVWAHGYWGVNWADAHLPVIGIDAESGRMSLGGESYGGIQDEGAFRIYNLPEELDTPGEWYLDRASGLLYYWPKSGSELANAAFSTVGQPILRLRNARHIHFENLIFEVSRSDLVRVESGTGIVFERCEFRGSGLKGLYLNGDRNRVEDCLFEGIGDVGIALSGGDQDRLRPGANLVVDSVVREFGEVYLAYSAGIHLSGVGNTVAQNYIAHAPHEAMQIHGNLNRVLRNEIAFVCEFSDDAGAIYSGRDWSAWGNEITANYIHDIRTQRTGPDWVHAIYLDDGAAGFTIRRNIIENIDAYAVNAGGGRYNVIDENVFINARGGHLNDNRGAKWIVTTPGDSWNMFEKISEVDRLGEPWKSTFPGLAMVPTDSAEALAYVYPDGSEFTNNAGFRVSEWVREQDWTGRSEGVFSHYAAFHAKPGSVSLPAGGSLVKMQPRRDIAIGTAEGAGELSFSQMGLQNSSWETCRSTRGAAIAAFDWDETAPRAGSSMRFRSTTAWASDSDGMHFEWLVNGTSLAASPAFDWTPAYGGVHRITLKVRTSTGAQDQVTYRIAVDGETAASGEPAGPTEDSWQFASWFDDHILEFKEGWIQHYSLGWMYPEPTGKSYLWTYTLDFGWVLLYRDHQWIYFFDEGDWNYLLVGSRAPRWFYSNNQADWVMVY